MRISTLFLSAAILLYASAVPASAMTEKDPRVCTLYEECDDSNALFGLKTTSEHINSEKVGSSCHEPLESSTATPVFDRLQNEAKQLLSAGVCSVIINAIVPSPSYLKAMPAADSITLNWQVAPSDSPDSAKFNISREMYTGFEQEDNWVVIATNVTGTTYQDKNLPWGEYLYRIEAAGSSHRTQELLVSTTGASLQAVIQHANDNYYLYLYSTIANDKLQVQSPNRDSNTDTIPWIDLPLSYPAQGNWKTVVGLDVNTSQYNVEPQFNLFPMSDWIRWWSKTDWVNVRRLDVAGGIISTYMITDVQHQ